MKHSGKKNKLLLGFLFLGLFMLFGQLLASPMQVQAATTKKPITLTIPTAKTKTLAAPKKSGYQVNKIAYKISKKGIVSVKKSGTKLIVTAKKTGKVNLTETITYKKGSKKTSKKIVYAITVKKQKYTAVALDLQKKKSKTLSAPKKSGYQAAKLTYKLSKKGIVKVKKSGSKLTITAQKTGKVNLIETISYKKGKKTAKKTRYYTFTVTKKAVAPTPPKEETKGTYLYELPEEMPLTRYGSSDLKIAFTPTLTMPDAPEVAWSCSNDKVVGMSKKNASTVTLTAKKNGTADITATFGSQKAVCHITVTDCYTYTISPVLAPFNEFFYVKTDDPDPTKFRFLDEASQYDSAAQIKAGDFDYLKLSQYHYLDIQYEKKETKRIAGGYLFVANRFTTDGGQLKLQSADAKGKFQNTAITLETPACQTAADFLIKQCTTANMSFFAKLDAVQSYLSANAVYPHTLQDKSKPNTAVPYPSLNASRYPELSLNAHYTSYQSADEYLFLSSVYPFVLDSLGFPGTMATVAKKLPF